MTHTPLLVPVLQAPDWNRRDLAVHQPLVNGESEWMPVLTFADDMPQTRTLRTEGDPEALRGESSQNLARLRYDINLLPLGPDGVPFPIAVLEGGEYASEQVLNVVAMREVAARLGCEDLVVAVPFRGALMAVDMKLPKQHMSAFLQMMSAQYFHARSKPISPIGLMVVGGIVCGEVAGLEESGRNIDGREPDYAEPEVSLVLDGDTVRVTAGGSDQRAVTDAVTSQLFGLCAKLGMLGIAELDAEITFTQLAVEASFADGYRRFLVDGVRSMKEPGAQVAMLRSVAMAGPDGPVESLTAGIPDLVVSAVGEAPVAVFLQVATADGRVEQEEIDAFLHAVQNVKDPLVKAGLVANQEDVRDTLQRLVGDPMSVARALMLTRTLPGYTERGVDTIRALMNLAVHLAAVSADGPVRALGDLRPEERKGVEQVANLLNVQL